jgi:hypothetical protein
MSKTVKTILKESFEKFKNQLQDVSDQDIEILNTIEDDDLIDTLDMVIFLFPSDSTEIHLKELMDLKGVKVSEEQFKAVLPVVERFVIHMKKIKSLIIS